VPTFRYAANGSWFKGNTHLHSTFSDGGKTVDELAEMYAGVGYDFLFRSDHWVTSDVSADGGNPPLLWLDGIEIDGLDDRGSYFHAVCLGTFRELKREDGFTSALHQARSQGGLTILAHPHWTGNSFDDALHYGFDGVEVYNHVCRWLNGKGHGGVHWSAMLSASPHTLAFACDDAHVQPSHPGWNGGWIMVRAPSLSREAVMSSIRSGRFYSSCGPVFRDITFDGERVAIQTSPIQFARLVGPNHLGTRVGAFDGRLMEEASFAVPGDWPYAYLEIEDSERRRAWTNTLFID
jgi:hypothetical protein